MDISYYKKYEPIFGSWHIVREIGEGSFGKVFEIKREDFGRTYKAALKAITIPQNQSEVKSAMADGMDRESVTTYFQGFVEELVDEFAIMSELKGHSNIVSYEDHQVVKHSDGIGWDILIRMELLTPLIDRIQNESLSRAEAIKLGRDICKALEACRESNIIHRDIKPENIFVSKRGDFKLGDFGIAKTVEKTTGGLSKKGTYTYMAPEIYKGESYGASVDIYSLGIVLYRFFNNNRTPFLPLHTVPTFRDREAAMARRIKGETIPVPVNADEELAKVILKACAYDPKERYSSPTEMRIALESLGAETAVSAPAMKNTTENISEAETVRDIEETAVGGTVLLIDEDEGTQIIADTPDAGETTVIEETAVGGTVLLIDEDEGTQIIVDTPEAGETTVIEETAVGGTVLLIDEDEGTQIIADTPEVEKTTLIKEDIKSKVQNSAHNEQGKKTKKNRKKLITAVASLAAVLLIATLVFLPKRVSTEWAEYKVKIDSWYVCPLNFTNEAENCRKIKFAYSITSSDNDSVYGTQKIYIKKRYGIWEYAGKFTVDNTKMVIVNLDVGCKNITGIAVVPAKGYGEWSYNISFVKCVSD